MADDEPIATGSGSLAYHSRSTSPKPTIRIESCRGDGLCQICGGTVTYARKELSCGCRWHVDCAAVAPPVGEGVTFLEHALALLTEALRQLSEAQAKLHPVRRVDPGFVIAPEDESNG